MGCLGCLEAIWGLTVRSIYTVWGDGSREEKTHMGPGTFVLGVDGVGQDG